MPRSKRTAPPSGAPETLTSAKTTARKPWRKKTPVEVVLEQAEKLRSEITEAEEELEQKRVQLKKFEAARKIFEGS